MTYTNSRRYTLPDSIIPRIEGKTISTVLFDDGYEIIFEDDTYLYIGLAPFTETLEAVLIEADPRPLELTDVELDV